MRRSLSGAFDGPRSTNPVTHSTIIFFAPLHLCWNSKRSRVHLVSSYLTEALLLHSPSVHDSMCLLCLYLSSSRPLRSTPANHPATHHMALLHSKRLALVIPARPHIHFPPFPSTTTIPLILPLPQPSNNQGRVSKRSPRAPSLANQPRHPKDLATHARVRDLVRGSDDGRMRSRCGCGASSSGQGVEGRVQGLGSAGARDLGGSGSTNISGGGGRSLYAIGASPCRSAGQRGPHPCRRTSC
jgi:hypothetical protein